ncbi:DUF3305 domain-containing protein [Vibrio sp. SM6]|uniref:DUF3305 domain-containing protein n=1 Tax=Vibrio agarilyticus TaxID=2726741 RepID=A0A7X8YGN4_9VIBR|nr:DUF3305 domain-containing protein [Vibrio agarilyticus]NLS12596.1 DUF3305 domain-containing protein [Vibrio agarilyticus]
MQEPEQVLASIEKSENIWPMSCQIRDREVQHGIWLARQWELHGFDLKPALDAPFQAVLQLYLDERADYRFNLSSQYPKLFVVLENLDDGIPKLVALTAAQSVAAQFMDGDYLVLSFDMPLPVQAWMEAFIGRHGELIESGKKKRKGKGRASGN